MQIVKFFKKMKKRIDEVGLFSTILYLFITVFLGKLGIDINFLFKTTLPSSAARQDDIVILHSIADLSAHCLDVLQISSGVDIDSYFSEKFKNNSILALGMVGDSPVSWSWLSCIAYKHAYLNPGDWVIHSCLTFSEARGLGFYPRSIYALEQVAFDQWQAGKGNKYLSMECSIVNEASIRGIEKSGLVKSMLLFKVRDHVFMKWSYD